MNKRKIIFISMLLVCLSCPLWATTTNYYLGLGLDKKPDNSFVITNGSPVVIPPDYVDDKGNTIKPPNLPKYGELGDSPTLQFSTPKNTLGTTDMIVQRFGIKYTLQTSGTFLVFFSAKGDLGYYTVDAINYMNPYMMKASNGTMQLNYSIDVVDGYDKSLASFHPVSATSEILPVGDTYEPIVIPESSKAGPGTNPITNSGVVYKKYVANPNKEIIEDYINFKLTMNRKETERFDSGLYYGYIVIHFNVND